MSTTPVHTDPPEGASPATLGDLVHSDAQLCVRNHVIAAMALGTVPVPVVDIAGVLAVSVRMVSGLSDVYGVDFSRELARAALVSLIPAAMPVALAGAGGSLLKVVPGLGTLVSTAGVSLLSGAVVYALGQVFIRHYEAGGTLADIDLADARRRFVGYIAQGRRVAAETARGRTANDGADTRTADAPSG